MRLAVAFLAAASAAPLDPLWLRAHYNPAVAARYRSHVDVVIVRGSGKMTPTETEQLTTVANELELGLSHMLGKHTPSYCCSASAPSLSSAALTVEVSRSDHFAALGDEGYEIDGTFVRAATPSGALYATYKLLSLVQRSQWVPQTDAAEAILSRPSMTLRIWVTSCRALGTAQLARRYHSL